MGHRRNPQRRRRRHGRPQLIERALPKGPSGVSQSLRAADRTLSIELRQRGARYGVIGVCIGSGQGVAVVVENPDAV
ncbi:hypothetical protein [Mycobacterium intracellulare]|uniref:hypothetical protein n=1 Tax=Mycobacterium intracellulare TaxID=1767 RepID=UPI00374292F7